MMQVMDESAERLLKNVAIGRSGVYLYTRNELSGLGITSIPEKYARDNLFHVYRPATVLAANAEKFVRQPLTNKHPPEMLTPENNRKYISGWVGDSVVIENCNDEIIIRSSVNLVDRDVIRAYDSGIREVSPGYIAKFSWKDGETAQGLRYNIVMDDIESVNHLALVPEGRGGPTVRIMDSGEEVRQLTSGLFRWIKRLFVADDSGKTFREILNDAILNRGSLSESDFDGIRDGIMPAVDDIPECSDKIALKRMIYDLWSIKNLTADGAMKYGSVVCDLYERLDTESTKSVTDAMEGKMPEEKKIEDGEMAMKGDPEAKEVVSDMGYDKVPESEEKKSDEMAEEKAEDSTEAFAGSAQDDADPIGSRLKALEDQMMKIAAMMESFGTKKVDGVAAHKSSELADNGKTAEEGVLKSDRTQVSDAAPVIETPASPFTATISDSKPSKSPKGIDLEEFDQKISNGGKK